MFYHGPVYIQNVNIHNATAQKKLVQCEFLENLLSLNKTQKTIHTVVQTISEKHFLNPCYPSFKIVGIVDSNGTTIVTYSTIGWESVQHHCYHG